MTRPRISDIRSSDTVFIDEEISIEDKEKIKKFVNSGEKKRGYDLLNYFENQILNKKSSHLIVESVSRTAKTQTEFAVVKMDKAGGEGEIRFKVQTRYLKLSKRKPKHPVTPIFV